MPSPHPVAAPTYTNARRHWLGVVVLLFVALIMVAPLSGWMVVRLYTPALERDAYANLEAIARLKAEQIETWLQERLRNAAVLQSSEVDAPAPRNANNCNVTWSSLQRPTATAVWWWCTTTDAR